MFPRQPPKISLRHDHDWTRWNHELGSTVEQQSVGKLVQQSCGEVQHATFSQLTHPKPKQICDRSGNLTARKMCLLFKVQRPVPMKIDEKSFHEKFQLEITLSVIETRNVSENTRVEQTHDGSGPNIVL